MSTIQDLEKARDLLLAGEVVAVPTETVYGLAASIESDQALRKVFAMKERPFFDPLIVHVSGFKQVRMVTREWPPLADYLARAFWPGPLTLVLPKADRVNPLITSGLDTVAVRQPNHQLALELIKKVGVPLAAPSANRFGKTSPSRAEHVANEFPNSGLMILDGGPCAVGLESTVVAFDMPSDTAKTHAVLEVKILRPGGVTEEELREVLSKWSVATQVQTLKRALPMRQNSLQSPGTLEHHYQPKIPLVIVSEDAQLASSELKTRVETALGSSFQRSVEMVFDPNPTIVARQLYSDMRRLAETGADLIFVRRLQRQSGGFWMAIWDRLGRAASVDLSR